MSKGIANAFRVPELRGKILLTVLILLLYRFGAYLPVPGAPFQQMLSVYQNGLSKNGAMAVLNLFSGGALGINSNQSGKLTWELKDNTCVITDDEGKSMTFQLSEDGSTMMDTSSGLTLTKN